MKTQNPQVEKSDCGFFICKNQADISTNFHFVNPVVQYPPWRKIAYLYIIHTHRPVTN
ncbi:MAG: hypothetical protein WCK13_07745 [Ignavibacteriota bacterium]|nr:hypothetical protein [Ignavibacteriota bacterium]